MQGEGATTNSARLLGCVSSISQHSHKHGMPLYPVVLCTMFDVYFTRIDEHPISYSEGIAFKFKMYA